MAATRIMAAYDQDQFGARKPQEQGSAPSKNKNTNKTNQQITKMVGVVVPTPRQKHRKTTWAGAKAL